MDSNEVLNQRYDNIINQIFSLQMKQLAESIYSIQKNNQTKTFLISFDPSEEIPQIELSQNDYNKFISYRDPLNCISVYDLFQEKTHSYENTGNYKEKIISKKSEKIHVAKKIDIKIDYCHHCKQRKPGEFMTQCKSGNCCRPLKTLKVNGNTILRSNNKHLIICKFDGNNGNSGNNGHNELNEFIDNFEDDKVVCKKFFCHFCLKGSYDIIVDDINNKNNNNNNKKDLNNKKKNNKNNKKNNLNNNNINNNNKANKSNSFNNSNNNPNSPNWSCPFCLGNCFCSRCTRNEKILKLIGYYLSLGGDINILYDDIISYDNYFLEKFLGNLVISKIIIIAYDSKLTVKEMIENGKKINEKRKNLDELVDKYYNIKEFIENSKNMFKDYFDMSRKDKKILKKEEENFENFLGKKKDFGIKEIKTLKMYYN